VNQLWLLFSGHRSQSSMSRPAAAVAACDGSRWPQPMRASPGVAPSLRADRSDFVGRFRHQDHEPVSRTQRASLSGLSRRSRISARNRDASAPLRIR
jgi:hypothetical protein